MHETYPDTTGYYGRDFAEQDGEAIGPQDVSLHSTTQYQKRHAFHISNQTDADPIPT